MSTFIERFKSQNNESEADPEAEYAKSQWDLIQKWKPQKDVWALIYGPSVLSVFSGTTGLLINHYYRNKLKLRSYGHFSSYLPIVAMPALISAVIHRIIISMPITLQKQECPICLEMRAIVLQNLSSVVYPLVLAPAGSYMLASRHNTVRVPMLSTGLRTYFNFHVTTSKGLFKRLVPQAILLNTLVAMAVTYMEFHNMNTVYNKMIQVIQSKDNS